MFILYIILYHKLTCFVIMTLFPFYKNMLQFSGWSCSYKNGALLAKFQPDVLNHPFVLICGCLLYTWFRDGPLEKLWGEGNFPAAGIFFRYQIPCMNFFRPKHEYFLGLIGVHDFFSFNFPLRQYFFVLRPQPPPPAPPISFLMVRSLIVGGERKGGEGRV